MEAPTQIIPLTAVPLFYVKNNALQTLLNLYTDFTKEYNYPYLEYKLWKTIQKAANRRGETWFYATPHDDDVFIEFDKIIYIPAFESEASSVPIRNIKISAASSFAKWFNLTFNPTSFFEDPSYPDYKTALYSGNGAWNYTLDYLNTHNINIFFSPNDKSDCHYGRRQSLSDISSSANDKGLGAKTASAQEQQPIAAAPIAAPLKNLPKFDESVSVSSPPGCSIHQVSPTTYIFTQETPTVYCGATSSFDTIAAGVNKNASASTSISAASSYSNHRKESNKMKGLNFDFGPCGNSIRLSAYGLAIQNKESKWVSYDKNSNSIIDVEIFNIDSANMFYNIPVALSQIAPGDIIKHCGVPMFVTSIDTSTNVISAVDPSSGELKNILPTLSPFGFNFITKIVSLLDNLSTGTMAPSAENPFGNMGALFLLSQLTNDKSSLKSNKLLPLLLFSSLGAASSESATPNLFSTPLSPLLLMALLNE